jgi:small-conductance mechanosensitive channel
MIALLLAATGTHTTWRVPPWILPDTEHLGVVLGRLLLTALAAWAAQRVLFLVVRRGEHWLIHATRDSSYGVQRAQTIGQVLRHFVTTMVAAWAIVHGLEILGWDVKPLLVGASILGAALGFGAQFLVRDIIAGTFIFVEDQFVVGDVIEVNGQAATVEAVTLRSTRLRDFQGRQLYVPNGEMKVVVNHSRGWNRAVVDVLLATGQDLERALSLAEAVAAEVNADPAWRDLLLEPFTVVGLERTGPEGATVRVVARARPGGDAARLAREMRLRLLQRWKDSGIRTIAEPWPDRRPAGVGGSAPSPNP